MSTTRKLLLGQGAALLGLLLVTLGLYLWGSAEIFAQRGDRVVLAAWSIRCLAGLAICGGQLMFALVVIPALFSSGHVAGGAFERFLGLSVGLLAVICLLAGGALAASAGW